MFFIHMGGRTNIFYKQRDKCFFSSKFSQRGEGSSIFSQIQNSPSYPGGEGGKMIMKFVHNL